MPPSRENSARSTSPGRSAAASVNMRSRRASPVKAKEWHRGKGRRVTNINRINVINNFGVEGRGGSHAGWLTARIALAALMLLWCVVTVSVLRSVPLAPAASPAGARGPPPRAHAARATKAPASIDEVSLFGADSRVDFQLRTPHAPSCGRPLAPADVAFTLVSQLSEDRLWMVPFHCQRWGDHPMSIAVSSDRTAKDVTAELVSKGCSGERLTVQTVGTHYDPTGKEYPVNLLRNVALAAVATSHVVYADVDFWPSANLYDVLSSPAPTQRFAADPKFLTIVPAFQMFRRCREYKDCKNKNLPAMPTTRSELFALIRQKQASTFDPTNRGGHGSTKYITWRDQDTGTLVDLKCIKSNRFEPYLAFRYCADLPPFQERFTGYGKNKMTVSGRGGAEPAFEMGVVAITASCVFFFWCCPAYCEGLRSLGDVLSPRSRGPKIAWGSSARYHAQIDTN